MWAANDKVLEVVLIWGMHHISILDIELWNLFPLLTFCLATFLFLLLGMKLFTLCHYTF